MGNSNISGRIALRAIDNKVAELRQIVQTIGTQVGNTSRHVTALMRQEADLYQKIGQLRLEALAEETLGGVLGAADRQAVILLDKHENLLATLTNQLQALNVDLQKLEAAREAQSEALANASEAYDQAVATTREKLLQTDTYKEQYAAAELAADVAEHAMQKTKLAETDRTEKGKPYETDPLFFYLWKRGFGTPSYLGKGIVRSLDGWVARICDYDKARRNYHMLLEIPRRLAEHGSAVAEEATAAEARLEALEREALSGDGVILTKGEVEQAQAALQKIDQSIEELEAKHLRAVTAQAITARGEDEHYQAALQHLVTALKRHDLQSLRTAVEATPIPEDDLLVEDLKDLEEEQDDLARETQKNTETLDRWQRILKDLEEVRRAFKKSKYDSIYSEFKDWYRIDRLLTDVTTGEISQKTLWTRLKRSHRLNRRHADFDFGGGDWASGRGLPDLSPPRHRARRGSYPGSIFTGDSHWGSGDFGGSFGGGLDGNWGRPRRGRLGRPRSMPRFPTSKGGGGFKTGGGF